MTNERKNEIWAMLDADAKKQVKEMYVNAVIAFNQGRTAYGMVLSTLEELFNRHNLTSQAEEKPKEPRFKVGDKVLVKTSKNLSPRDMDLFRRNPSYVQGISDKGMVTVATDVEHSVTIPIEDIVPWVDEASAESVETSMEEDAYFTYRLDLAKEIAVAMIKEDWSTMSVTAIALDAVDMANEIVKRLKETEE